MPYLLSTKAAFDPAALTIVMAIATLASSGLSDRLRAIIKAVFRRPTHESTTIVHIAGTDKFEFIDTAQPANSEDSPDKPHDGDDPGGQLHG
jgi:hypothetical protein